MLNCNNCNKNLFFIMNVMNMNSLLGKRVFKSSFNVRFHDENYWYCWYCIDLYCGFDD